MQKLIVFGLLLLIAVNSAVANSPRWLNPMNARFLGSTDANTFRPPSFGSPLPKYSGERLYKRFYTDTELTQVPTVNQAHNSLKFNKLVTNQKIIDSKLLALRDSLQLTVNQGNNAKVIEQAHYLIELARAELERANCDDEKKALSTFILDLHGTRRGAFYSTRKYFEAMLEMLRSRTRCNNPNIDACTDEQIKAVETVLYGIKDEIKAGPIIEALGLEPSDAEDKDEVRKRCLKLTLLLHPDKNQDLNEQDKGELTDMLNLVTEAKKNLLGNVG